MKIIPVVFAILLFFSGCTSSKYISPEEAKAIMEKEDDEIILDVREQGEFDEGIIPGSVLLPISEIDKETASQIIPSKESLIFIFCHGENRSENAYKILTSLGYNNIYDLGDVTNWPYTKDIVTSAAIAEREKVRTDMFPDATSFTKIRGYELENVSEIYAVDDSAAGLVISCHSEGYGGRITVLVGFNSDSSIKEIAIVEAYETPGLGSKIISEQSFLNSFIGFSGEQLNVADIDAITGATMSSQAVVDAVNVAISALNELNFF